MRVRSIAVPVLVLCGLVFSMSWGGIAHSQESPDRMERARQHYMTATQAEQAGQYDVAVTNFTAAYEITKDPKLFYQIARAYELSGKNPEALAQYQRYAKEAKLSETARKEVEERIARLEKTIAETPAPTEAPSEEAATAEGEAAETPTEVAEDAATAATLTGAGAPPVPRLPPPWQRTAAWTSVGIAAVFLTTGGVLATAAASREEDIDRLVSYRDPDNVPSTFTGTVQHAYDDAVEEGENLEKYAGYALIGAGVATAAAITFFTLDALRPEPRMGPAPAATPVEPPQARIIAPFVGSHAAGVSAFLEF